MKAKGLALLFILLPLSSPAQEWVRVRLASKVSNIEIAGNNIQVQGMEEAYQSVAIPSASGMVSVQQSWIKAKPIWKVQLKGKVLLIAQPYLKLQGQLLRWKGKPVPDRLVLDRKTRDLIALVPLEDYVKNVVSNEMPLEWPDEALKAQAIIARSYVKAMQKTRAKLAYDVESSVMDQVFQVQAISDKKEAKLREIIEETKGTILTNKNTTVAKTFYHSDCGGSPQGAKNIWSSDKVQVETPAGTCIPHQHKQWSAFISNSEMKTIFSKLESPIFRISFLREPTSERVGEITINSGEADLESLTAEEFRRRLGYSRLKSTLFTVTQNELGWTFTGTGNGHGVGLCQWGAKALASHGSSVERILKTYYPDLILKAANNTDGEEQDHRHNNKTF